MEERQDSISRQAALDILHDFAGCIIDTPNGDYHKAYKAYRHRLEILPFAQPERKTDGDMISRQAVKDIMFNLRTSGYNNDKHFAELCLEELDALPSAQPEPRTGRWIRSSNKLRFIDLFSGIGGIRKGFELACSGKGIETECVFSSEIKYAALKVFHQNHPMEGIAGDVTVVDEKSIPDFDVCLAGFPCQAFSSAGKRLGFMDTRGTLFFDVERILAEKKPMGFVLENVEGLVNHDKVDKTKPIGRTLETILQHLDALGYHVSWKVLNAKYFGVPQERKRIYIVGCLKACPSLDSFPYIVKNLSSILEQGLPCDDSPFVQNLLSHYNVDDLKGRSIKDKRGGSDNIHSWDIEMKGPVSMSQKELLNAMLTERRKKKWAEQYGIDWMDGMPLTIDMIRSFYDDPNLEDMLEDLCQKKYIVKEHPKKLENGRRIQDTTLPLGYNIVAGKMSFKVNKILDPNDVAPTLVAMDMQHLYVPDGNGIRQLSLREGLRLFGYPDDFKFTDLSLGEGYDLLGNTVVVPVIKAVSERLLEVMA